MVRHTSNIQSEKVLFRQTFDSPVEIAKAGGVITGSPSFKSGIVLDGSTDYITYGIPSTIFDKSELTVVIEFIPDFEAEDGLNHWFCDATNGQRFYLAKPTNNRLVMYVGAVAAINASAAEFSPYWEKGKRNVLVIVITTGANFGYLNGTQIDTTSNSITPVVPTEFYIGSNYTGVNLFDGTIKSLSIHNRLFTDVEAQALYDNSLFSFQNKAEIWLDMKSQTSDGTNQITKDKSPNGNHFLLGDGTTTTKFPSFSAPGFDLDGSSDYLLNDNAGGVYNSAVQSMVLCFRPDFSADDGNSYFLFDSTPGAVYSVVKLNSGTLRFTFGGTLITDVVIGDYGAYWIKDGINVLVVSCGFSESNMWLNKTKIIDSDSTVWTPENPTEIYLGCSNVIGDRFDGELFHFSSYAQKLNPIQVEYITSFLLSEYK